jgi:hypothetical protein
MNAGGRMTAAGGLGYIVMPGKETLFGIGARCLVCQHE